MSVETLTVENQDETTEKEILGDNTIVDYPADKLKILRKCMGRIGFVTQCYKATGVTAPTLKRYLQEKNGRKKQVEAVVAFSGLFNDKISKA